MTTNSLQALFDIATQCFHGGDWLGARENCEKILAKFPGDPRTIFLLSQCYEREGRLQISEEHIRLALKLAPSTPQALKALAVVSGKRDSVRTSQYFRDYMLDRFRYRDYPRSVGIETTGRCNAACNFCPQSQLERRDLTMSDHLFAKIISELREIPEYHPLNIFPNQINEPFMDRKFFDRLGTINTALPRATLHLFSNMNVMHRDFFERIAVIKNIRAFNVSFNAATREEYERVMGIDFERTVNNVRKFMAFNREHRIVPGLILSRVSDGTPADAAFDSACQELFAEFTPKKDYITHVKPRADWLGSVNTNPSPVPYAYPCSAWFDLNITCTGVVPHCCTDAHGKYSIGDVNKSSVLEIYNSKAFRHYRENLTSREQAHPCNSCSQLQ